MKKILTLALVAVLGIAAFSGCKKSSSGSSYTMGATVGASAFNANWAVAEAAGPGLMIMGWNGSGTTAAAPYIMITLSNFTGTGSYSIDSVSLTNVAAYYPTATTVKNAKSGTVTITSSSTASVGGTFTLTLDDGTSVSGGKFTAKKY